MTVFLIAAYSKYSCPYVWVRTNHERLINLTGDAPDEKDNPLKLQSTGAWATEGLFVLCCFVSDVNPFLSGWLSGWLSLLCLCLCLPTCKPTAKPCVAGRHQTVGHCDGAD